METKVRILTWLLIVMLSAGLVTGCGAPEEPPSVSPISVQPSTTIFVGETASLAVSVSGSKELEFEWIAERGLVGSAGGSSGIYTAPNTPGADIVTIKVTSAGGSTFQSITFDVQALPTPTSTATPVPQPTETFTPAPSATLEPTSTLSPTSTPVTPLLEIFPQSTGGEAFVFKNGGELVPSFSEGITCRRTGLYGLRISYAMQGNENAGWGIHWDKVAARSFDAATFKKLTFWVRGDAGDETFQIGLKDLTGREVKIKSVNLLVVSASDWRQVSVDLAEFTNVNTAAVSNLNFGFNKNHRSGTICVDDIAFE